MDAIKFKSTGRLRSDIRETAINTAPAPNPLGFVTPLRLSYKSNELFAMHHDLLGQIEDNLRNLILTNHGERLGVYDLGANLRPLMTELNTLNEEFELEAISRIKHTVGKYMPFVNLISFTAAPDYSQNEHIGKIILTIVWSVPQLNTHDLILKVTLFVA